MKYTEDVYLGSFGRSVYELQTILERLGYGDFVPTGYFGSKTLNAVIKFQTDKGIEPNQGYVGPKTRKALSEAISDQCRNIFYQTALSCLGIDATPEDSTPDEYACAETVNEIYRRAFGSQIGGGSSTYSLYRVLLASTSFARVDYPIYGDIIISPTGYGNGGLSNGHVGIVGKDNKIMSNSSRSGLLESNYTLDSWKARYKDIGGYPVVFFRILIV